VTIARLLRWWPPVGVLAMLALGWAVGKGATPVDNWFTRHAHDVVGDDPRWLLILTDGWLLTPVLAGCVAGSVYQRHWRLAALALASPFAVIQLTEGCKNVCSTCTKTPPWSIPAVTPRW
jgi:hypothetical protein